VAEEAARSSDNRWEGSPLQMGSGLDPYGIREIVIQYDTGEEEVLRPKLREEFHSYELQQASHYLETLAHQLRLSGKR
jgi:hypothetical protein